MAQSLWHNHCPISKDPIPKGERSVGNAGLESGWGWLMTKGQNLEGSQPQRGDVHEGNSGKQPLDFTAPGFYSPWHLSELSMTTRHQQRKKKGRALK